MAFSWLLALLVVVAVAAVLAYFRFKGQWHMSWCLLRALIRQAYLVLSDTLVVDYWRDTVKRLGPNKPALIFGGKTMTLGQVDALSNQVAHFLVSRGVQRKDTIALFATNRLEYFPFWLGATKIGASVALINYNQRTAQLLHSLTAAHPKLLIFEGFLAEALAEILGSIRAPPAVAGGTDLTGLDMFCFDGRCDFAPSLDEALAKSPDSPVLEKDSARGRGAKSSDDVLYIYTSGTTGLPKAAAINHVRFISAAYFVRTTLKLTEEDRLYTALPLYHSAGGILGIGQVVLGSAMIICAHNRGKFSASNFWSDVRQYEATVIQYIGEICRYLLAQPRNADDAKNKVRVAFGNGLRPDIWQEFKTRYNIGHIGEFYGATEGALLLMNTTDVVGCIGYIPPLFRPIFPFVTVKFDVDTEECIRGPDGFCIRCQPNEVGEGLALVTKIKGVANFQGYKNKEANKKKLLQDVFKKGDQWSRTGDLLRIDANGCVFFVDRIGDTFRWKGENVSTNEVAEILSSFSISTREPNVYGVAVPGKDGRAGMVAFPACYVDGESKPQPYPPIDLDGLAKHVCRLLPPYSRPLFVRVLAENMEITGTFKHKKTTLVAEGFDPNRVTDRLYFLDGATYTPLTPELYQRIVDGSVRL